MAAACDRVEESPLGLWLRASAHPKMWVLNQLQVQGPQPDLTADALVAELDRGLADVGHRRAQVDDDATGRRLAGELRTREGWKVSGLLVMALDGTPEAPPPGTVREADDAAVRALDILAHQQDPDFPQDDLPVVVEAHAHVRATVPGVRCFVSRHDGVDASWLTLYCDGRTGQPEDVNTLAAHRGHGLAALTVNAAGRAAREAGCDLVFLVVDAEQGPVPLYASLGYRVIGRYWAFTKPDPPSPSRRPPA